jgi:hypothetical protein
VLVRRSQQWRRVYLYALLDGAPPPDSAFRLLDPLEARETKIARSTNESEQYFKLTHYQALP